MYAFKKLKDVEFNQTSSSMITTPCPMIHKGEERHDSLDQHSDHWSVCVLCGNLCLVDFSLWGLLGKCLHDLRIFSDFWLR